MKNMLKKLSVLLFCIVCVFAIVGCDTTGGNKNENTKYTSDTYPWPTTQTDSLKLTKDYAGKDFITDGKATLEGKGTNAEGGSPLFVDFVITSNGFHVPLEGNDRRYFVPTVLDGAQDDKANKLIHEVNAIIKNDDNLSNKELKEYYLIFIQQ